MEKKKEEKLVEEKEDKKDERYSNQLKWIIIILGIFIVFVFIFYSVQTDSLTFEYIGLNWQKEPFGDLTIYTTYIVGYSVTGSPIEFKMPFRNDPRTLNVSIEGDIDYIYENPVYISLDFESGINECGSLGLINLGRFMTEMRFKVVSAVTDKNWSQELDRPIANCEERKGSTIFILTKGEKTKIVQDNENQNCYYLYVNDCEDIKVLEKLELATLAKYTGNTIS